MIILIKMNEADKENKLNHMNILKAKKYNFIISGKKRLKEKSGFR